MTMAACEAFWNEKVAQAEKVVRERYPLLRVAETTPTVWAADHAADLLQVWTKGLQVVDAHWSCGEFVDDFKAAVLAAVRAWMEMCKRFEAALRLQEAA
jgi:hypothetical protein